MSDEQLREELAMITAKEHARMLHEVTEDRFVSGLVAYGLVQPGVQWPVLNEAALHGLAGEVVECL